MRPIVCSAVECARGQHGCHHRLACDEGSPSAATGQSAMDVTAPCDGSLRPASGDRRHPAASLRGPAVPWIDSAADGNKNKRKDQQQHQRHPSSLLWM